MHDGPNEASTLPTNLSPKAGQLGKLVYQKKDDKFEIKTHNEDGLLNAINFIR